MSRRRSSADVQASSSRRRKDSVTSSRRAASSSESSVSKFPADVKTCSESIFWQKPWIVLMAESSKRASDSRRRLTASSSLMDMPRQISTCLTTRGSTSSAA